MAPSRTRGVVVFAALALVVLAPAPAAAQLIGLRSLPVASGDQFLIRPSARLGMASTSITLRDPWLDPFVNPAKGADVEESAFFGAPTFYGISQGAGGGRTLPLAGLFTGDRWFGGGTFALQQIHDGSRGDLFFVEPVCCGVPTQRLSERSARNLYAHGVLGRRLGERLAVGASLAVASLGAVDGVDLLYQGSQGVDQSGDLLDIRVGLSGSDEDDRRYEMSLLHHRVQMRHDVRYVDWVWVDSIQQGQVIERLQTEHDETRTWGLHGALDAPLAADGWRLGGLFTINRKSHPKIPNYELQNIPRDPGDTWAFDMGVGMSRENGPVTVGLDLVFEPIWSQTWSVADSMYESDDGRRFDVGDKEIENDFFFTNVHLRVGAEHRTDRWGAQMGLETSSYAYTLEQVDNVLRTRRNQDESWMEWTPTWGVSLRLEQVELSYAGRVTTGTGRPGVDFVGPRAAELDATDFIVAPSGPLTLQDVRVLTHQVVVRLPIR